MKEQFHILFISSWYPTAAQPFLGNFVKRHAELIASKHRVTVLNLQSDPSVSGITCTEASSGNLREILVQYPAHGTPLLKLLRARKAFRLGASKVGRIDLIHGNVILSKGMQFVWAKKYFKKPLVVSEHASYYRSEASGSWSLKDKITLRKVMKAVDCLTAVSPFLKNAIQKQFPSQTVEILPNVIDTRIFTYQPKAADAIARFVHISTLDERVKNISGIIAACNLLKAESGNIFSLLIISDESYAQAQKLVREAGLEDCISFAGPMQPAEIAQQLQASDALVMFSDYETFSIVIAEAWATGTPVISTPVGIAQSLDPQTGIQVQPRNVESLKQAMRQIARRQITFDPAYLVQQAAHYAPEEVLQTIEDLYSKFTA